MKIIIDDILCDSDPTATILAVARENGIEIPSLCAHKVFGKAGACRICCVEILEDEEGHVLDKPELVSSCTTSVQSAARVRTRSPRIDESRAITVELLRKRVVDSPAIRELIERYHIYDEPTPYNEDGVDSCITPLTAEEAAASDRNGCILCGLCVRACKKTGKRALAFYGMGDETRVVKPSYKGKTTCDECGICQKVCPTGAAALIETINYDE